LAERFGHRAYDDLPNIHFEPVDQPDAAILWSLIDGLDNLATLQDEFDFICWSVVGFLSNPVLEVWMLECMSDSEGYVQVLKEDDWLYVESTSELYKGRQNLEPVPDHSAIAKALGWRHLDAIPNDFVLLRNDASAGQALSLLALQSISALHRLIRARRIVASVAESSGSKPKVVSTLRRRTKRTR
jgi:hypothetical protein